MLQATQLSKRFGDHQALDALTLAIAPGEVFCLLGSNGASKTATINLFLGFLAPTQGSARVDGLDVAADPDAARVQKKHFNALEGRLIAQAARQLAAALAGSLLLVRTLSQALAGTDIRHQAHFARAAEACPRGFVDATSERIAQQQAPGRQLVAQGIDPTSPAKLTNGDGTFRVGLPPAACAGCRAAAGAHRARKRTCQAPELDVAGTGPHFEVASMPFNDQQHPFRPKLLAAALALTCHATVVGRLSVDL